MAASGVPLQPDRVPTSSNAGRYTVVQRGARRRSRQGAAITSRRSRAGSPATAGGRTFACSPPSRSCTSHRPQELVWWCDKADAFDDPAHGGKWDEYGVRLGGPAPIGLSTYEAAVVGDRVAVRVPMAAAQSAFARHPVHGTWRIGSRMVPRASMVARRGITFDRPGESGTRPRPPSMRRPTSDPARRSSGRRRRRGPPALHRRRLPGCEDSGQSSTSRCRAPAGDGVPSISGRAVRPRRRREGRCEQLPRRTRRHRSEHTTIRGATAPAK